MASDFLKKIILQNERRIFAGNILTIFVGYIGLTLWLNAIRANASPWLVWPLIIIQLTLYCLIFYVSFNRAIICRLKYSGWIIGICLVLGRVNDWEIIILPALVAGMLIFSARNKNVSPERQQLLKDQ
jgi:hypothetical protein